MWSHVKKASMSSDVFPDLAPPIPADVARRTSRNRMVLRRVTLTAITFLAGGGLILAMAFI
jgi:hypothetical protein